MPKFQGKKMSVSRIYSELCFKNNMLIFGKLIIQCVISALDITDNYFYT